MFNAGLCLAVLLSGAFCLSAFDLNNLHEFMTDDELRFYFKTADRRSASGYEVVYLPTYVFEREAVSTNGASEQVHYTFNAFGEPINLRLKRNEHLVSNNFKSFVVDGDFRIPLTKPQNTCHYLHQDGNSVGAVSMCMPRKVQGILFLNNTTLEIHPLTERLEALLKVREPLVADRLDLKVPHIVKRVTEVLIHEDALPVSQHLINLKKRDSTFFNKRANNRPVGAYTAELALFFDEAAYKIFAPYMGYDERKLQDMILAYMNSVQALYHHPSLGMTLELVLVRLDIMRIQPSAMPHYSGERGKLLDSFCAYQDGINPAGDDHPDHWDMGLYISGLDFFAYENGRKSGVTMGLATVGGVCIGQYACVIAEFGTTNVFGKPYPSAGFTSVYILAHEIGHNLGMHHDSTGNNCPKEGYIMSPSRGTNGETQWSSCSAEVMSKLSWAKCLYDSGKPPSPEMDHSKFTDTPGQIYTAKKQCEILLRDKDAYMIPNQELSTICYNLQCKTPHRSGYYQAGPALEGTQCGNGKYCFGGDCVDKIIPNPVDQSPGGWGPWKTGACNSGCLLKSRGYQEKKRSCNSPLPLNTDNGCEGNSYEVELCKDDKMCLKKKRATPNEYASEKCAEFSKLLPHLDSKGSGLQAPHEDGRLWMGCAIFCRRSDTGSFYTPRIELNDLGVSPYFPDGTWCHSDNGGNYYCLRHHCLPEHFQFTKSFLTKIDDDLPFSQNAHVKDLIRGDLMKYLSLDRNGKPLQTTLKPSQTEVPRDEDWETDDYLELPEHLHDSPANVFFDEEALLDFID